MLVTDPRRCRLVSPRPFAPRSEFAPVQVVEWLLFLLHVDYALPDAIELLRLQRRAEVDLSGVAVFVPGHDLAIEIAAERDALVGSPVQSIATADDAWQAARLIASHCDIAMPRFHFQPL